MWTKIAAAATVAAFLAGTANLGYALATGSGVGGSATSVGTVNSGPATGAGHPRHDRHSRSGR